MNIAESARDALVLQREIAPSMSPEARALVDKKIADYEAKIRVYEKEKAEIKTVGRGLPEGIRAAEPARRPVRHGGRADVGRDRAARHHGADAQAPAAVPRRGRSRGSAWCWASPASPASSLHPDFLARMLRLTVDDRPLRVAAGGGGRGGARAPPARPTCARSRPGGASALAAADRRRRLADGRGAVLAEAGREPLRRRRRQRHRAAGAFGAAAGRDVRARGAGACASRCGRAWR